MTDYRALIDDARDAPFGGVQTRLLNALADALEQVIERNERFKVQVPLPLLDAAQDRAEAAEAERDRLRAALAKMRDAEYRDITPDARKVVVPAQVMRFYRNLADAALAEETGDTE